MLEQDSSVYKDGPPGYVRAFDVRTGEPRWSFSPVPREGDPATSTWQDEAWRYTGAGNTWSTFSVDEELGLVYVPTSGVTNDMYGGHRLGANLYGSSIVALDAITGERVWHFQTVHHDLFDYDLPAAPVLIDITVDGEPIAALAQVTKQGFLFVLDRATGEPVWPIEERPVPTSTVPGEVTSPTQPHPTKPPPSPKLAMASPVFGFSANKCCWRTVSIRASSPVPQYATPLLIMSDGSPSGPSMSGFCVHSVRPVLGSMASVRPWCS